MSLESLQNIGPSSAKKLRAVGITSREELASTGAMNAYQRVKAAFPAETNSNLLYALVGALHGTPWQVVAAQMGQVLQGQADEEEPV